MFPEIFLILGFLTSYDVISCLLLSLGLEKILPDAILFLFERPFKRAYLNFYFVVSCLHQVEGSS